MEEIIKNLRLILDKEGVFQNYCEKVLELKQDKERIRLVVNILKKYNIVPPKTSAEQKGAEQSKKFRDAGNYLYSRSTSEIDLIHVCEKYSKSIAFAPNQSNELAISYANTSAILLRMERYEDCLRVIDKCLNLNYPDNLKIKVLLRKVQCFVALKDPNVKVQYEEVSDWIDKNVSDTKKQKDLKIQLQQFLQKKYNITQWNETDLMNLFEDFHYQKINKEVPSSSDALTIRYNDTFGRHIVAARNIRPGEILAKETPYCLALQFTKRYMYCWRCMEAVWNCIPCERCVNVAYCSEICKQEAWTNFHRVECDVLSHVLRLSHAEYLHKGVASLRMAILAVRELGQISKLVDELKEVEKCKDPRIRGFSSDGKYYSNKYRSVYSLYTTTSKRDGFFLLHSLTYASLIMYLVATETNFFGNKLNDWSEVCMNEDALFIGSLVFRNFEVIHTNGFSGKESRLLIDKKKGVAIFPFFSFLNHSCKPNVAKSCRRNYDFLYAIYPIKQGEQIYISYIPDYANVSKICRQDSLYKTYFFKCECIACRENWPVMDDYPTINEIVYDTSVLLKLSENMTAMSFFIKKPLSAQIKSTKDVPTILLHLRNSLELILEYVPLPCKEAEIIIRKIMLLFEKSKYITP